MKIHKNSFIFLDLDGTIIDTLEDIHNSLMLTLEKYGFQKFSIDTTKSYVGDGIKKLIERSVGKENYRLEIEKYFRNIYNQKIIETSNMYKDMDYVLSTLRNITDYLFIISNKSFDFTDKIVKHFGLDKYFLKWFGGDSFSEKKPSPIPVLEIFKIYNKTPDKNSFIIGDNYTDIESGYYAGISTIFCNYGYGKIKEVKPDYEVNNPLEILDVLEVTNCE
ncbi:phosphoglycolate phosphatase [Deferribacter desulfuricans SSM1]|uniref:phosphoglycolate phosphatase n=1 Tax=Deferribacter desulfuricans (strain DSM 14783 / JCM 11476 / NBRC 101012 / SSM1) TaxID=639282 RepID=D3PDL7_DEFDS|nr:HAD family hydrolase [Deferribacter desulfuricans]BAI80690.1 phosphoglycolate phosphatase [Deferribacter desulfuricans SSM1]